MPGALGEVPVPPVFSNPRTSQSRPVIPYTISQQDRTDWKAYRTNLAKYRENYAVDFLKVLGSLKMDVKGAESINHCKNDRYKESTCNMYQGFANVNVSPSLHVPISTKLKLPATWKEWNPVECFLNDVKNSIVDNRLDAAWCEFGNFHFDRPPTLQQSKSDHKFPYVNIACKGPPIYWTFNYDAQVYSCKIRSQPGHMTFDKESLIFVGKMIPTTLVDNYSDLDIAFGVVLQTAQKRGHRTALQEIHNMIHLNESSPDKYVNVFEMIVAPSGIAAVTVDWGLPSRSSTAETMFMKRNGNFKLYANLT